MSDVLLFQTLILQSAEPAKPKGQMAPGPSLSEPDLSKLSQTDSILVVKPKDSRNMEPDWSKRRTINIPQPK